MKIIFLSATLLLSSYSISQSVSKIFGGSQDDRGKVIIECANSDIIIGGTSSSFGSGGRDIILTRFTTGGQLIWSKAYGLSGDEEGRPLSLFEASNGDILLAFRTFSINQVRSGIVARLNSTGDFIWQKKIGQPGGDLEGTRGIFEHTDGSIYVGVGTNISFFGSSDGMVSKLDASGNLIWSKTIGEIQNDHVWSIIPLPNGEIMLNMNSEQLGPGARDAVFVKLDALGNILTQVSFGGTGDDIMFDMAFDVDFGYITTGITNSFGQGGSDAFIAKFDVNLNLKWFKTYGGNGLDYGSTIEIVDSNHFVMYMNSDLSSGDKQMSIVGVDSNGVTLYTKSVGDQYNQVINQYASSQGLIYSPTQDKTFLTNSYENSNNVNNILFLAIDGKPDVYCKDTVILESFHTPTVIPVSLNITELGVVSNVNMNVVTITNLIEQNICPCPFSPPNLSDTTICAGSILQYNLNSNLNYQWEPAGSFSCSNCPNPTFIGNSTTSVTVYVDNGVCEDTLNFTITLEQVPVFNLSGADTICASAPPIILDANNTPGTWSGVGITNPQNGTFNPAGLSGDIDVYFTPTSVCGDEDTLSIFVEQSIAANILSSIDTLCFNLINDTLLFLNAQPHNGYWSGNGITDSVNGYLDENYINNGQVTIVYTPYGACVLSDTLKFEIIEELSTQIISVDTLCQNENEFVLTLSNTIAGSWSGNGITNPLTGLFDPGVANVGNNQIIFSSGNQCVLNDTIDIVVAPVIIGDISIGDTTLCIDENPIMLSATPNIGTWSGFISTLLGGNTFFDPALNGQGSYLVKFTPDGFCAITDSIIITVDTLTSSSFTLIDFCAGNSNAATNISIPGGIFSFNPSVTDGATINSSTGEISNGVEGTTYIVEYAPPGSCISNSIREVTVKIGPIADFSYDSVCVGEINYFVNQTLGNYDNSYWIFMNDTDTVQSENASYIFPTSGDFNVTLIVNQNGLCSDTITHSIYVKPLPNLFFTANPMSGTPVLNVNFHNDPTGLIDNFWNFGDGNYSSELNNIVSNSYTSLGEYIVTRSGTAANGCTNSYSLKIIVEYGKVIYDIPNVVTPNHDGVNDGFYISYLEGFESIENFEIMFLNRWGNVIITYNKPDFVWDGRTKSGNRVVDGTYFYLMNFNTIDKQEYKEHGFVHVINE